MPVTAFDKLLCSNCGDIMLHHNRVCVCCETPNNYAGAKPIVRPQLRFNSHQGKNFRPDLEAAGARRRARQARSKALSRIRA